MIVGVVFNPFYNELFTAARGEGATLNGKTIHVSKVPTLSTSLLCTGFPVHKRVANPNIHYYWDFTLRSHGVRRDGSAALDLACVAAGRFDAFWEFGLQKWDTAAGVSCSWRKPAERSATLPASRTSSEVRRSWRRTERFTKKCAKSLWRFRGAIQQLRCADKYETRVRRAGFP